MVGVGEGATAQQQGGGCFLRFSAGSLEGFDFQAIAIRLHEQRFDLVNEFGRQFSGDQFGRHPFNGLSLQSFLFLTGQRCLQDVGWCPAEHAFAAPVEIQGGILHGQ